MEIFMKRYLKILCMLLFIICIPFNVHAETTVQKLGPYERLEDVPAQYIEQTLKALETYRMNLYDVIIQDLREVLVFSTWETSWFNL